MDGLQVSRLVEGTVGVSDAPWAGEGHRAPERPSSGHSAPRITRAVREHRSALLHPQAGCEGGGLIIAAQAMNLLKDRGGPPSSEIPRTRSSDSSSVWRSLRISSGSRASDGVQAIYRTRSRKHAHRSPRKPRRHIQGLTVNVTAVTYGCHFDKTSLIIDAVKNPVVANSNSI